MSEHKKSLPVLLIASLCMNGVLLGVAGGMWIAQSRHHDGSQEEVRRMDGPRGGGRSGPFEERLARMAIENLGEDERREFRKDLSREWKETRENREAIEQARARVLETLSAETLDESAAAEAFADLREAEMGIREKLHTGLVGLMKDLPAEKRQDILKRSQEQFGHHGDKRRGDRDTRSDRYERHPDRADRRFEDGPDKSDTPEPDQK